MTCDCNAELWVSVASAVVAACALVATLCHGRQTREHNKLSVKPVLTTMEHHHENDRVGYLGFELINSGVGPAIIKDFIFISDGQEVSKNNRQKFEGFIKSKTSQFKNVQHGSYVPGATMHTGEKCLVLAFNYDLGQSIEFAHGLNLVVNYKSIYEDKVYTYDSRIDRQFHGFGDAA